MELLLLLGTLLLLSFCSFSFVQSQYSPPNVTVTWDSNNFLQSVAVNNQPWLQTNDTFVYLNTTKYSLSQGNLKVASQATQIKGTDTWGTFQENLITLATSSGMYVLETRTRIYNMLFSDPFPASNSNVRAISFSHRYLATSNQSPLGPNHVQSSFPSFGCASSPCTLGGAQWGGGFAGSQSFTADAFNGLLDAAHSGPMVFFDSSSSDIAVFSPLTEFMAHGIEKAQGYFSFGVLGTFQAIPQDYTMDSFLYFDSMGVNEGVIRAGDLLLTRFNKHRDNYLEEFTTKYLGYCTDNGAYYYYHTEENKNYEQTMLDVLAYAQQNNLPYQFALLDSWWYFKGINDGVKNWTAMPSIFPNGLENLHTKTSWPFIAHNRYFSPDTDYAKQNKGSFNFIIEKEYSLPDDQTFWDYLMKTSISWGLRVYEQDWLLTVWDNLAAIRSDITLGRRWLHQMGTAAAKHGVNIQYCMPYVRHLMAALESSAVVQSRASGDNVPGSDNYRIGDSSLILYAIGIAPYKDNFWTTSNQPNNPYHGSEPAPDLQAITATLSTGPVTPSDMIGGTNTTIVMSTCRTDGLLLKPDRPAFDIESRYRYRSFGSKVNGPNGNLVLTHTELAGLRWYITVGSQLQDPYSFTLGDLNDPKATTLSVWQRYVGLLNYNLDSANSISFPKNGKPDYVAYYISPIITTQGSSFSIIGETDKYVPISKQRISSFTISTNQDSIAIGLLGAENEPVTFAWVEYPANGSPVVYTSTCRIGSEGTAALVISAKGSSSCHVNGHNPAALQQQIFPQLSR